MRRLLQTFFLIAVVSFIAIVLVIYSQGKRLGSNGQLTDTGILQVTTIPNNANVYLNGSEKGQADISIENLKPGTYTLKVSKDRYNDWEKVVTVKKGLVTPIKVTLFPNNPSLTALTFDGIFSPALSPDGKKVAFGIQNPDKAGVWIIDLADSNLFFSNAPREIVADTPTEPFSHGSLQWSPDNQNVLVQLQETGTNQNKAFLLKQDSLNTTPEDVTDQLVGLTSTWDKQIKDTQTANLKQLGIAATTLADDYKSLSFSKNNNSVLIIKKDGSVFVYDSKPSPVPNTPAVTYSLPPTPSYSWYSGDEKHLIVVEGNSLSLMDSDGTNQVSLFTGDFDPKAVYSWPDGSRLVILINLNSKANPLPNLYTINLR